MTAQYTLKVVAEFSAAHLLRGYPGDCSRLHGHNWTVEVELIATALDSLGMGMDFKALKTALQQILAELDHRHLNDVPPFDRINPTAENLAAYLYQHLSDRLHSGRTRLGAVTLWETERACVRYEEG